ncbi:MAG: S-layer protein, partial [Thermococcus sp.]
IQDIGIQQNSAIILVTDTQTDQQVTVLINATAPAYIYYDDSGQLTWSHDFVIEAGLYLELRSTFVGIDNTIMASIYYVYDMKTYTNDNFHPEKGWNATIGTYKYNDKWYIANVTLINDKELKGNPLDILGAYDLVYKFETHSYDKYYNGTDVVKAPKNKHFITAYAYICLKEKEGKVVEKELKVGDEIPDSDYTIEGIYATATTIELKPVTEPIVYMDYEINVNDPGSNLILVGGPVANSVTKYLVENNVSEVDWYSSAGDVEYLQDALGGYDVVIVAGATRNETRVAAKKLMEHIAELAKE